MINCRMVLEGKRVEMDLKGHANYERAGKDIVCAAASTLCNTFVEYVKIHNEARLDYKLSKGDIHITVSTEKEADWLWEITCFMAVGFYIIACSYPKYFSFKKNF